MFFVSYKKRKLLFPFPNYYSQATLMEKLDLHYTQTQLTQRLLHPYNWKGVKQNDEWDRLTNFIYGTAVFNEVLEKINHLESHIDFEILKNYTLNRWLNFWSAMAVETIFCNQASVKAAVNARDRLVDFTIQGITFDHKTSVYPRAFGIKINNAQDKPELLLHWLYKNQSSQQRQHFANRLFIVLHNFTGEHWKLKADIGLLKKAIESYVANFEEGKLVELVFEDGSRAQSDIIWVCKER